MPASGPCSGSGHEIQIRRGNPGPGGPIGESPVGENSDPAKAKGALGQVQVGFLEYIPRRGVPQVEIAAGEDAVLFAE